MNLTPDLIGQIVQVWHNHLPADAPPTVVGKLIGYCDHPTAIIEDAEGRQFHLSSQLRMEVKPLPAEPDSGVVAAAGTVWLQGSHGWFNARKHGERVFISWVDLHLLYDDGGPGCRPKAAIEIHGGRVHLDRDGCRAAAGALLSIAFEEITPAVTP